MPNSTLFNGIVNTIKEISKANNYNFNEQDCFNIAHKLWSDIDYVDCLVKYADDYYNNKF
jgi:hypothetical protein